MNWGTSSLSVSIAAEMPSLTVGILRCGCHVWVILAVFVAGGCRDLQLILKPRPQNLRTLIRVGAKLFRMSFLKN
eukprot:373773-Amphidinium_carterae.1